MNTPATPAAKPTAPSEKPGPSALMTLATIAGGLVALATLLGFVLHGCGHVAYSTYLNDWGVQEGLFPQGFYPEITDGCKRAENFWSCLATLRRILGLWNRSMYSNTSALAASSVG